MIHFPGLLCIFFKIMLLFLFQFILYSRNHTCLQMYKMRFLCVTYVVITINRG